MYIYGSKKQISTWQEEGMKWIICSYKSTRNIKRVIKTSFMFCSYVGNYY